MNLESKRRLLGATVLVALVVIFVPMFVPEPEPQPDLPKQIPSPPLEPPMPDISAEPPIKPVQPPPPEPQSAVLSVQKNTEKNEPIKKPRGSWVIQVASYSSLDRARKKVQELRSAGFDTLDPQEVSVKGQRYYRVRVGPFLDKAQAKKEWSKVQKVAKTKTQIYRYH